jgi:outer membrane protein assembly factor BamA
LFKVNLKKELTFKEGDRLKNNLLEESERRLRSRRYFSSATVVPVKNDDGSKVNVDVHEVWTLVPKLTYSTAGGNTHYGYGIHDSNFLGLGKTVKVERSTDENRTSDIFAYRDPNFNGQNQLLFSYADNSDGKAREFAFANPFKSVKTPWAGGFDFQDFTREDTLYNAGEEVSRFAHENSEYSLYYGIRLDSSDNDRTRRLVFGIDDASDSFLDIQDPDELMPSVLPFDRNYKAAWLEYSYQHNRYIEGQNIQQINRTEDINLGSEWRVRLGIVDAVTPVLDNSILFQLEYTKAFQLSLNQLISTHFLSSGFYSSDGFTQAVSQITTSYHWTNFERGQFFVMVDEIYGENLNVDTPLELGGDTGLRGYPARYMAGNRSRLLTIEQRYFGETEWFSLFHLGAAVFYDQGRAWGETTIPQTYQNTLRNVGIGLRISGTRTGARDEQAHSVAHLDLSYPLDGSSDIDKYQFSIRIKTSF